MRWDADGWLLRGNATYSAGQQEEALEAYDRSLELRPDDPNTLTILGVRVGQPRTAQGGA